MAWACAACPGAPPPRRTTAPEVEAVAQALRDARGAQRQGPVVGVANATLLRNAGLSLVTFMASLGNVMVQPKAAYARALASSLLARGTSARGAVAGGPPPPQQQRVRQADIAVASQAASTGGTLPGGTTHRPVMVAPAVPAAHGAPGPLLGSSGNGGTAAAAAAARPAPSPLLERSTPAPAAAAGRPSADGGPEGRAQGSGEGPPDDATPGGPHSCSVGSDQHQLEPASDPPRYAGAGAGAAEAPGGGGGREDAGAGSGAALWAGVLAPRLAAAEAAGWYDSVQHHPRGATAGALGGGGGGGGVEGVGGNRAGAGVGGDSSMADVDVVPATQVSQQVYHGAL